MNYFRDIAKTEKGCLQTMQEFRGRAMSSTLFTEAMGSSRSTNESHEECCVYDSSNLLYVIYSISVDTQRRSDVLTTLFHRYGRWMDVKVTSCACWDIFMLCFLSVDLECCVYMIPLTCYTSSTPYFHALLFISRS